MKNFREFLLEDPQYDKLKRNAGSKIWENIIDFIDKLVEKNINRPPFMINCKDFGGEQYSNLYVAFIDSKKFATDGAYFYNNKLTEEMKEIVGSGDVIFLYNIFSTIDSLKFKKYSDEEIVNKINNIFKIAFIHEFNHYMDYHEYGEQHMAKYAKKYNEKMRKTEDILKKISYYINNPLEFEAHFNSLISLVEDFFKEHFSHIQITDISFESFVGVVYKIINLDDEGLFLDFIVGLDKKYNQKLIKRLQKYYNDLKSNTRHN